MAQLGESKLVGALVAAVAYGLVIQLSVNCVQLLLKTKHIYSKKMHRFMYFYVATTLLVATVAYMQGSVMAVLTYRYLQEGPVGQEPTVAMFRLSDERIVLPFAIANADTFMIWRCNIIYRNASWGLRVLTYTFFSVTLLAAAADVILSFSWAGEVTLIYGSIALASLTLAINMSLALLITFKILHHQRCIRDILGPAHASVYSRVITISVESCALIVVCSGVYVGLNFAESISGFSYVDILLPLLPQICAISPLLVIVRVAQGRDITQHEPPAHFQDDGPPRERNRIGPLVFAPAGRTATSTSLVDHTSASSL